MRISITLTLILLIVGCINNPAGNNETEDIIENSASWLIKINNNYCAFDQGNKTMLFPIDSVSINGFSGIVEYSEEHYDNIYLNDIMVGNGENFNFDNINVDDTIRVMFKIDTENVVYSLLFTTLPTVLIFTEEDIVDEPKKSSEFIINDILEGKIYDTHAGIEIRGGPSSQNSPKKSYDLELWENENGLDTRKEELFGLRNDADWHLDAMYFDETKSKNILGMKIWEAFSRSKHLVDEEEALLSQRGELVEVFLNNNYLGIYSFNEQIDRKQLRLKKSEGLLYKAEDWTEETTFQGISIDPESSLNWSGYELKHPEDLNALNWEPLYEFIYLVAYAADDIFNDSINTLIDIENVIDYFIFINLIQANDNTGKNMYICRYDENYPLFFIPWDLDRTLGWYDNQILTNRLFTRLYELDVNNYRSIVKGRWNEINQNNLLQNIMDYFEENINKIILSNAGNRDNVKWNLLTNYFDMIEDLDIWVDESILFFNNYISTNY
jgi:hypothetical protein